MNLSNMLQEFATQILDDSLLSGGQQEEKMIQVLDLCHFIDIYKQSLKIVDYGHKINIVEEDGVRKGIYFCDLLHKTRNSFDSWFFKQNNLREIRSQLKIKELWFVIVEENLSAGDLKASKEFVQNNNVDNLYDRIFYFNLLQSTIKIFKKLIWK